MPLGGGAQPGRIYGVGVVHQGGAYRQSVDGLRDGLRDLGFEEGKQFVLDVRDTQGDLPSVEAAAKSLEAKKVDVILSVGHLRHSRGQASNVERSDRVLRGDGSGGGGPRRELQEAEGRLTGIHGQFSDVTGKRLRASQGDGSGDRRPVAFFNPANPVAQLSVKMAHEAASRLKLELVERPIASVAELRAGLRALAARARSMPLPSCRDAMVIRPAGSDHRGRDSEETADHAHGPASVAGGALAAYGED
jgi:putative ABC transport system substrate-binding protein